MKKKLWTNLDSAQLEQLAHAWLREIDSQPSDCPVGQSVVWLGFTAPLEQQWDFILIAVALATLDQHSEHIAAGPVECLLSRHGEGSISLFEKESQLSQSFALMMRSVEKHLMSDDIWNRVKSIQESVEGGC